MHLLLLHFCLKTYIYQLIDWLIFTTETCFNLVKFHQISIVINRIFTKLWGYLTLMRAYYTQNLRVIGKFNIN